GGGGGRWAEGGVAGSYRPRLASGGKPRLNDGSGQLDGVDAQRPAVAPDQDQRVVLVEAVHLHDALEILDGVVLQSGGAVDLLGNGLDRVDALRRDLHAAADAVGDQQVVLAALFIGDDVQRAVAVAQLGDGRALDLLTRHELADRDLDQRRALVGRQQVGLALDVEGGERPHRRGGL